MTETTEQDQSAAAAAPAPAPKPRKPNARKSARAESEGQDKYVDMFNASDKRAWDKSLKDDDGDDDLYEPVVIELADVESVPANGQPFVINGRVFPLRSGVRYRVPGYVTQMISHIVSSKPVVDDNDRVTGYREGKKFPFTTHSKG